MDKKTKGCLLIGCGSLLFLAVVTGVILIVMGFSTYKTLKNMTSKTPLSVPVYKPTDEEKETAEDKVNKLMDALKNEQSISQKFTSEDINTLIATDPRLKEFRGRLKIDIADNKLKLIGSVPLKFIPGFKDRYINGDIAVNVGYENDRVKVSVEDMKINGKPAPAAFTAQLRQKNLIEKLYKDPRYQKLLNRIKNIKVENNNLIVEMSGSE